MSLTALRLKYPIIQMGLILVFNVISFNTQSQDTTGIFNFTKDWQSYSIGNEVSFKLPPYFKMEPIDNSNSLFFMRKIGGYSNSSDYDSSIFIFQIQKLDKTASNEALRIHYLFPSNETNVMLNAIQEMIDKQKSSDFVSIKNYKLTIENIIAFNSSSFENYYSIFYKSIIRNKKYHYPLLSHAYFVPGNKNSFLFSFICTAYDLDYFGLDISTIKENIKLTGLD